VELTVSAREWAATLIASNHESKTLLFNYKNRIVNMMTVSLSRKADSRCIPYSMITN